MRSLWFAILVTLLPAFARGQTDDFNAGNDAGWTRYDPIGDFGNMASYSFPHGGYRIAAPGTGDPFVGGGRAGSLREDQTYSSFQVAVDLTDLDTSHPQAVGLLTRITDPSLLTTDGYALTYAPLGRMLNLSRVDREVLISLGTVSVPGSAASLRLVFTGVGPSLAGQVFDDANLATPLASLAVMDRTSDHGFAGLLVEDTGDGNHGAAATFDNYSAMAVNSFGGDANLDAKVDFNDLLTLSQHYGITSNATLADGDFNADGRVNFDDLTILAQNYGRSLAPAPGEAVALPEPSSAALIVAAVMLLLRRTSRGLIDQRIRPRRPFGLCRGMRR